MKTTPAQPVTWANAFAFMRRMVALLGIAFTTVFGATQPASAQSGGSLRIVNLKYFDSFSRVMVPATSIVIQNGEIVAVNDDEFGCSMCDEIDLGGGYVIPGLIDLHQHLGTGGFGALDTNARVSLFRKNLYWGITTVFNPSIPDEVRRALQAAVRNAPARFPRFITAGRHIGPEGGWGDLKTATVGGLKAAINAQINGGAAIIKLSYDDKAWLTGKALPLFSEQAMANAIDYAHERERRVFIHTNQVSLAKKALRAGADGITSGLIVGEVDDEFINLMRTRRAAYMATFSTYAAMEDNPAAATRQKAFDPKSVHRAGLYASLSSPIMRQNWRDWYPLSGVVARQKRVLQTNTAKLINAGLNVGVGSDAGTPGVIFGAALPDEMQRHVDMGVRPADVLYLATSGNARILFLADKVGSIAVGMQADLVLLRQDPTQSIGALKSVEYTVRAGQLVARSEF